MKIAVVSPVPTHPQSAGNRSRVFFLCQQLRGLGHDVHILYLRPERQSKDDAVEAMRLAWPRLDVFSYEEGANARVGADGLNQLWRVDDWFDDRLLSGVTDCLRRVRPDAVIIVYAALSRLLDELPSRTLKIIDAHDVHENRNGLLRANGIPVSGNYSFSPDEEQKALKRADCVLAIQKHDAAHFESFLPGKVVELGLWMPPRTLPQKPGDSLAFFSSANHVGHVNFLHFDRAIWPILRRRRPALRLAVAGGICAWLEAGREDLTLWGFQEHLESFLGSAAAFVSAEVFATGISTKNMTAMSYGVPVITTPCGARGLEEGAGTAFLTAETAEEFAQKTLRVLDDPAEASRLSNGARGFIGMKNEDYLKALKKLFPAEGRDSLS